MILLLKHRANKSNLSSGKIVFLLGTKCAFFGIFEIEGTTCGVPLKNHKLTRKMNFCSNKIP